MKKLLKKEFTLTAAPITYFFLAFAFMTLIPGYPILVGAFFICLGIFYTVQYAREYNDILYTALLPIKKSDVVRTKYAFSIAIQMLAFLVNVILTVIRMNSLSDVEPYADNPMMNANLAYLGYTLLIFTAYNIVFLGKYFNTAYYFGKPFVYFCIVAFIIVGIGETLTHIPGLEWIDAVRGSGVVKQGIVLAAGVMIYIVGTFASMKQSIKKFETIDL